MPARLLAGVVAAALLMWQPAAAQKDGTLSERRAAARKQQAELRERIATLQKELDAGDAARRDATKALKASESAISTLNRELADLQQQEKDVQADLKRIQMDAEKQTIGLAQRRQELADQLRAQYASGLSPWTALLSGGDPQSIGRDLTYLGYVSQAQANMVRQVQDALQELKRLDARAQARKKELVQVEQDTLSRKADLLKQQVERETVLQRIEDDLRQQRGQANRLTQDESRLGGLITNLEKEIAREQERRRLEAIRREQEARRLAQEREAARQAEQAARQAQLQAQRERDRDEAERARQQVEQARARARSAEAAQKAAREQAPVAPSSSGQAGLRQGLPYPVSGEVQGRFGSQRPEGGVWRGIVIRSAEGTSVRSVADGKVVYSGWLGGFGNLLIVDHGEQYLSVYAYNQSLLHEVGDTVRAGQAVATVGSTGGQVEPGLYFEIRHKGSPINPQLWLRR